ncbi:hypothetical protein V8D89_010064 [Ganoderma adspersum]
MSDSHLPYPDREARFAPPNPLRGSTESICPSRPNTPLPELPNDSSFREDDPLDPTEQQPSRNPNLVASYERTPGPTSQDEFVHLSATPVNRDSIQVTFPNYTSQARSCPFRLFDCAYFLRTGELALWQFNDLSLQVKVATPRFEEIKTWMDFNRVYWVTVSYDTSNGPLPVDSEGTDVRIRSDVLKELCKIVINRFKMRFLWLDKLCVFQHSTKEVCRWRMPAHVKWAFGLAKGTFFLPNGLNQMFPSMHGGKYPVPDCTSDLAVSFRIFLELAFNDNLRDVIIPLTYPLDASHPEQGHPSTSTNSAETYTPDYQVFHVLLKDILKEAISDGVPEVGDASPMAIISPTEPDALVAQTQASHDHNISVDDINDRDYLYRVRIKALLTVLSCRDYLKFYYNGATDEQPTGTTDRRLHYDLARNPMLAIADWEDVIWCTALFYRKADSPAQLVFGLAWLLQDLCDIQHPAQKSALDLVSPLMDRVMEAKALNPMTGETEPDFPMVPFGLSLVVNQFNEISGPCSKLASWNRVPS